MRKLLALFLAGLCITASISSTVSAGDSGAENPADETCLVINGEVKKVKVIQVFHDGSRLLEEQATVVSQNRGSITAQKPHYYCNSSGTVLWTVTVTGTFSYNGSTSSCTGASYSTQVHSGPWSQKSGSAYPSGNSAIADVVMARKLLGIVVETVPVTITLTCDKNGNLS